MMRPERHCPGDPRPLVLASASPRRRELLTRLGLAFIADASDVEETVAPGTDIEDTVLALAEAKARDVGKRHPGSLVIGADTLVGLDSGILGKPRDAFDAAAMLTDLSGREHRVLTGIALLDSASSSMTTRLVQTNVRFRELSHAEIDAYVRSGEPLDKAGAYGAQGLGATLLERIEGDYFNVVGLPLVTLNEMLRDAGACILCRVAGRE